MQVVDVVDFYKRTHLVVVNLAKDVSVDHSIDLDGNFIGLCIDEEDFDDL